MSKTFNAKRTIDLLNRFNKITNPPVNQSVAETVNTASTRSASIGTASSPPLAAATSDNKVKVNISPPVALSTDNKDKAIAKIAKMVKKIDSELTDEGVEESWKRCKKIHKEIINSLDDDLNLKALTTNIRNDTKDNASSPYSSLRLLNRILTIIEEQNLLEAESKILAQRIISHFHDFKKFFVSEGDNDKNHENNQETLTLTITSLLKDETINLGDDLKYSILDFIQNDVSFIPTAVIHAENTRKLEEKNTSRFIPSNVVEINFNNACANETPYLSLLSLETRSTPKDITNSLFSFCSKITPNDIDRHNIRVKNAQKSPSANESQEAYSVVSTRVDTTQGVSPQTIQEKASAVPGPEQQVSTRVATVPEATHQENSTGGSVSGNEQVAGVLTEDEAPVDVGDNANVETQDAKEDQTTTSNSNLPPLYETAFSYKINKKLKKELSALDEKYDKLNKVAYLSEEVIQIREDNLEMGPEDLKALINKKIIALNEALVREKQTEVNSLKLEATKEAAQENNRDPQREKAEKKEEKEAAKKVKSETKQKKNHEKAEKKAIKTVSDLKKKDDKAEEKKKKKENKKEEKKDAKKVKSETKQKKNDEKAEKKALKTASDSKKKEYKAEKKKGTPKIVKKSGSDDLLKSQQDFLDSVSNEEQKRAISQINSEYDIARNLLLNSPKATKASRSATGKADEKIKERLEKVIKSDGEKLLKDRNKKLAAITQTIMTSYLEDKKTSLDSPYVTTVYRYIERKMNDDDKNKLNLLEEKHAKMNGLFYADPTHISTISDSGVNTANDKIGMERLLNLDKLRKDGAEEKNDLYKIILEDINSRENARILEIDQVLYSDQEQEPYQEVYLPRWGDAQGSSDIDQTIANNGTVNNPLFAVKPENSDNTEGREIEVVPKRSIQSGTIPPFNRGHTQRQFKLDKEDTPAAVVGSKGDDQMNTLVPAEEIPVQSQVDGNNPLASTPEKNEAAGQLKGVGNSVSFAEIDVLATKPLPGQHNNMDNGSDDGSAASDIEDGQESQFRARSIPHDGADPQDVKKISNAIASHISEEAKDEAEGTEHLSEAKKELKQNIILAQSRPSCDPIPVPPPSQLQSPVRAHVENKAFKESADNLSLVKPRKSLGGYEKNTIGKGWREVTSRNRTVINRKDGNQQQ